MLHGYKLTKENLQSPNWLIQKPSSEMLLSLYELINYFANRQEMLAKTHEQLLALQERFRVICEPNTTKVIASGLLDIFTPTLAEIKSLAVDANSQGKGLGRKIVESCEDEARALGVKRVFILTYQVAFFEKLGYRVVDKVTLPEKVYRECNECPFQDDCNEIAMIKVL